MGAQGPPVHRKRVRTRAFKVPVSELARNEVPHTDSRPARFAPGYFSALVSRMSAHLAIGFDAVHSSVAVRSPLLQLCGQTVVRSIDRAHVVSLSIRQ